MTEIPSLRAFAQSAERHSVLGTTVCPLQFNEEGYAKVPTHDHYQRLRPQDNSSHDWSAADGLGIVLGPPSGGFAVIDVDDIGLSECLLGYLRDASAAPPLMVRTPRGRLHVYCIEPIPSLPLDLEVRYQGRRCLVQLLAAGCVAAAPPTPGYTWLDEDAEPFYGVVGAAWNRMAKALSLPYKSASPYSFLRRERSRGPTTAQIREALRW